MTAATKTTIDSLKPATSSENSQTAKKSGKDSKGREFISPDTKSKLGQYLLFGITFSALIILSGGTLGNALFCSAPLVGVSLVDYQYEALSGTPKLKLKNDKRGWTPELGDIAKVALPIISQFVL